MVLAGSIMLPTFYITKFFKDPISAIEREKQIKSWSRKRKDALIIKFNPKLMDLYRETS